MATETRYVVKCEGRADARCRRLDSAQCIARAWKDFGERNIYIEKQTITTRRIYTV